LSKEKDNKSGALSQDEEVYSMTVVTYMVASLERTAPLLARDYKDPPIVFQRRKSNAD
jgi:hypothetical protein